MLKKVDIEICSQVAFQEEKDKPKDDKKTQSKKISQLGNSKESRTQRITSQHHGHSSISTQRKERQKKIAAHSSDYFDFVACQDVMIDVEIEGNEGNTELEKHNTIQVKIQTTDEHCLIISFDIDGGE